MSRSWTLLGVLLVAASSARGGDPPGAPVRPREALERRVEELSATGDRAALADALATLASACGLDGDYAAAIRHLERARPLYEALGDAGRAAAVVLNQGNFHNARGEFERARELHEAALERFEALGDRAHVALVLGNLGNDAVKVGDYPRALEHYERSLAILETLGDRSAYAHMLGALASLQRGLGNVPKALETARRALAAAEASGERGAIADALAGLGSLEHAAGHLEAARTLFDRQIGIVEELGDRPKLAHVLANVGTVQWTQGEHAKAAELLGRALAIQEDLGLSVEAVHTRSNLAIALASLDRPDEAIARLEASVEEADRLRLNDELAYALGHLAQLRLLRGERPAAVAAARRGAEVVGRLVQGLGDEQGAFARGVHRRLYETGLLAAVQAGDAVEGARFQELGRAGALREALASRDAIRATSIPAELSAAEDAARAREAAAIAAYRAAVASGDRAAVRARRVEVDAATTAVEEAIDRIQRTAKRGASLSLPRVDDLGTLQAHLAPNEAFLTYTFAGPQAVVLVVTRAGASFVGIGKVEAVLRHCGNLHLDDPEESLERIEDVLRNLGGHVVRRFPLPEEVTRIVVSPDGVLGYVPFTLLFPGREIAYVPSFTTYDMLLDDPPPRGEGVLALGDPDYGAAGGAASAERGGSDARGGRLAPLPATRAEAKAVGDVVLLGKDASEAGLRTAIAAHPGRFRAIHFACHGLLDPDHPARCSLALTPSAGDDGFLTARELLMLPIPADLAVLSACETAKGTVVRGEGILGLTRAFVYAGAPRVLCSLWKVDDEATQALMTRFYEAWKGGASTAAALRRAQDHVRSQERWKHPYYWAAWVLWGDPR